MTKAVKAAVGNKRVAPPEDKLYTPAHDLLVDKVFERKKKGKRQEQGQLGKASRGQRQRHLRDTIIHHRNS